MMKYVVYGGIALFFYALCTALFPVLLPAYLVIDLGLVAVVSIAMCTRDYTGACFGLFYGYLLDLYVSPAFGLYMLIYGLSGFVIAEICVKTRWDNLLVAAGFTAGAYLAKDVVLFLYALYSGSLFPLGVFIKFSFLSAMVTAIVGAGLYLLFFKLHELHFMRRRRQYDYQLYQYDSRNEWQDF